MELWAVANPLLLGKSREQLFSLQAMASGVLVVRPKWAISLPVHLHRCVNEATQISLAELRYFDHLIELTWL